MKELDWKILIVLYEKRSITKTAESLYLTQSAVTKRLQNIENEWGIHVIRRSSQGVSFTEDGTYLAQRASVMLDFLWEIREHYAGKNCRKETLTIGIPNSFSRLYFPAVLSSYIERFDRLDVRLIPNSSEVILQKLVEKGLGITTLFGDKWRCDPKTTQLIQVYDAQGEPVSRRVWMMLSDRCFQNPDIADFVSLVEEFFS